MVKEAPLHAGTSQPFEVMSAGLGVGYKIWNIVKKVQAW